MIFSDTRLCIADLEDPAPRPVRICDFPDSRFYGGMWSPSGRWFGLGGYDPQARNGLWIYDMNRRQARKMLSGLECLASWSADEESLVYYVEPPILEIWTADIESLGPGKTFAEHDQEMAAYYTRMIRAYPQHTRSYLSRANCYSRLGELEEAIADIEAADRISGQTVTRARWLAELKAALKAGRSVPHGPLAGSMSYDSTTGIYTMVGSGLDIWDNADEFHFAYARLQGDGSITARIDSVEYVHGWTKAGVMIRNTLDPASQHGIVLISPSGMVAFQ
jgi:tetratricopeptide (TPR) repeat protein